MPSQPLPPPRAAETAAEADEVLRVWIVDRQEVAAIFPPGLYGEDVWKWGRLLANVARYIAHAHAHRHGVSEAEVLAAIRVNIDEEIANGGSAAPAANGVR
ncbi:MAG: DUF5076 domain-containing protein [Hyphomonadaceae bacterium]|nr:DUF5076 domain-containing protein [Hyphomonadaceae bacterium]